MLRYQLRHLHECGLCIFFVFVDEINCSLGHQKARGFSSRTLAEAFNQELLKKFKVNLSLAAFLHLLEMSYVRFDFILWQIICLSDVFNFDWLKRKIFVEIKLLYTFTSLFDHKYEVLLIFYVRCTSAPAKLPSWEFRWHLLKSIVDQPSWPKSRHDVSAETSLRVVNNPSWILSHMVKHDINYSKKTIFFSDLVYCLS